MIKLDYEKAFDRVSWAFQFSLLEARNFDPVWINWVRQTVVGGSMGIMVNGENRPYLNQEKV